MQHFDNNQLVCDSHMNCMLKDDLVNHSINGLQELANGNMHKLNDNVRHMVKHTDLDRDNWQAALSIKTDASIGSTISGAAQGVWTGIQQAAPIVSAGAAVAAVVLAPVGVDLVHDIVKAHLTRDVVQMKGDLTDNWQAALSIKTDDLIRDVVQQKSHLIRDVVQQKSDLGIGQAIQGVGSAIGQGASAVWTAAQQAAPVVAAGAAVAAVVLAPVGIDVDMDLTRDVVQMHLIRDVVQMKHDLVTLGDVGSAIGSGASAVWTGIQQAAPIVSAGAAVAAVALAPVGIDDDLTRDVVQMHLIRDVVQQKHDLIRDVVQQHLIRDVVQMKGDLSLTSDAKAAAAAISALAQSTGQTIAQAAKSAAPQIQAAATHAGVDVTAAAKAAYAALTTDAIRDVVQQKEDFIRDVVQQALIRDVVQRSHN